MSKFPLVLVRSRGVFYEELAKKFFLDPFSEEGKGVFADIVKANNLEQVFKIFNYTANKNPDVCFFSTGL